MKTIQEFLNIILGEWDMLLSDLVKCQSEEDLLGPLGLRDIESYVDNMYSDLACDEEDRTHLIELISDYFILIGEDIDFTFKLVGTWDGKSLNLKGYENVFIYPNGSDEWTAVLAWNGFDYEPQF